MANMRDFMNKVGGLLEGDQRAYHGTDRVFKAFKLDREYHGSAQPSKVGVWFASRPEAASHIAKDVSKRFMNEPTLMTVNLRLENPKRYPVYQDFLDDFFRYGSAVKFRRALMRQGHDAIEITNSDTDGAGSRTDWAVFEPRSVEILRAEPVTEDVLNEMRVVRRDDDFDTVIAYRDSIWLFSYDEEVVDDILEQMGKAQVDFVEIADHYPDVFVGYFNDGELRQQRGNTSPSPQTSVLVKKVMAELQKIMGNDLSFVHQTATGYGDETEHRVSPSEMTGKRPSVLYHGTSSDRLYGILRTGLVPGRRSNWGEIQHQKLVFGSASPIGALFHANRTAKVFDTDGSRNVFEDPFPVVIAFRVPDPAKLHIDYDVAAMVGAEEEAVDRLGYSNIGAYHDQRRRHRDYSATIHPKTDYAREVGLFAYEGRIPPNHIVRILTNMDPNEELTFENMEWLSPAAYKQRLEDLWNQFRDDEEE